VVKKCLKSFKVVEMDQKAREMEGDRPDTPSSGSGWSLDSALSPFVPSCDPPVAPMDDDRTEQKVRLFVRILGRQRMRSCSIGPQNS